MHTLRLIYDYLLNRNRKQNTCDVSILGSELFNAFLADLFFVLNDIDTASIRMTVPRTWLPITLMILLHPFSKHHYYPLVWNAIVVKITAKQKDFMKDVYR